MEMPYLFRYATLSYLLKKGDITEDDINKSAGGSNSVILNTPSPLMSASLVTSMILNKALFTLSYFPVYLPLLRCSSSLRNIFHNLLVRKSQFCDRTFKIHTHTQKLHKLDFILRKQQILKITCYKGDHCRSIENNEKLKQPSKSERTFLKKT